MSVMSEIPSSRILQIGSGSVQVTDTLGLVIFNVNIGGITAFCERKDISQAWTLTDAVRDGGLRLDKLEAVP
jgi:hypothetical protein